MLKIIMGVFICLSAVNSYAIEGSWKVQWIPQPYFLPFQSNRTFNFNLKLQIKDFIFRQQTIRWIFTITGCNSYKHMADIEGRNIYVDLPTLFVNSSDGCTVEQAVAEKVALAMLRKTSHFSIQNQRMIFYNMEGSQNMILVRQASYNYYSPNNLTGAYILREINNKTTYEQFYIDDKYIVFCSNRSKLEYRIKNQNTIDILQLTNEGCANNQLIIFMQRAQYYICSNLSLSLFDKDDYPLINMLRLVPSNYDKYTKQRQLYKNKQQLQRTFVEKVQQDQTAISPHLSRTFADALGKWQIKFYLYAGEYRTNIYGFDFVIGSNTMMLITKCSTFSLPFTLISENPIKIKSQGIRTVRIDSQCFFEGDDVLYRTTLSKVVSINVRVEKQIYIAELDDESDVTIILLQRSADPNYNSSPLLAASKTSSNEVSFSQVKPQMIAPANSVPSTQVFVPPVAALYNPNQIKAGRYAVLLIRRLDIPRKIIIVQNNSFTVKFCNELVISFTVSSNKLIKFDISKKPITNSCTVINQENLYIDFFSKITSFVKQNEDVYLKNAAGEDLISLDDV